MLNINEFKNKLVSISNDVYSISGDETCSKEEYSQVLAPHELNAYLRDGKIYAITSGAQGDIYVHSKLLRSGDVSYSSAPKSRACIVNVW